MTNLQKATKLLTYIKRHQTYAYDHYFFKNSLLYIRSYKESPYLREISDYREFEAEESDIPDAHIEGMEKEMIKIKESIEQRARHQKIKNEFYSL